MKLIIAGTRDIEVSSIFIHSCMIQFSLKPLEIISGGANGIDKSGEIFVNDFNNPELGVSFYYPGHNQPYKSGDPIIIPLTNNLFKLTIFPADWETHGKAAGPIRNKQMAEYADALLLIWDGESKGSANMKKEMLALNKPVYEVILKSYNTK